MTDLLVHSSILPPPFNIPSISSTAPLLSPQSCSGGAPHKTAFFDTVFSGDAAPQFEFARVIKLWTPEEEVWLLSFHRYFRNSWSLYTPYFNRSISSIKMKYHSLTRGEKGAEQDCPKSCCGVPHLITDRMETLRYIQRLEEAAAGQPQLALQLLRVCGTLSELNQVLDNMMKNIHDSSAVELLTYMAPLESGGAPAGFAAGITHKRPMLNNLQYSLRHYNPALNCVPVPAAASRTGTRRVPEFANDAKAVSSPISQDLRVFPDTPISPVSLGILIPPQPSTMSLFS